MAFLQATLGHKIYFLSNSCKQNQEYLVNNNKQYFLFLFDNIQGPSEEDLILRQGADLVLDGGRRKRREEEGQRWEERLQENWENCLVRKQDL